MTIDLTPAQLRDFARLASIQWDRLSVEDRHLRSAMAYQVSPTLDGEIAALALALADAMEERDRLRKENDSLRLLVAKLTVKSDADCHYCGHKMAECPHGFPGCALADDMMIGEDEAFRQLIEERDKALADLEAARVAIRNAPGQMDSYVEFQNWRELPAVRAAWEGR